MKKILLAGVAASVVVSGAAFAADMPSRHIEPIVPVAVAPVFTWTGFYVGANAGYAFKKKTKKISYKDNGKDVVRKSKRNHGFTGGGQVGYNYQIGQFVVGAEADINYVGLKGKKTEKFTSAEYQAMVDSNAVVNAGSGVNWFGTVRGRLGVAFDRALVYGTGGFAYGGGGRVYAGTKTDANSVTINTKKSKKVRTGWTLGAGVEYAFSNNLSARVEGMYVNLGKGKKADVPADFQAKRKKLEFGVVRAGLNYKFDSF